jgi:polyisoprenoid-binding protein YceI
MSARGTHGSAGTLVPVGRWTVDKTHSSVEFGIKHLMITTVKGRFTDFDGAFEADESANVRAEARIRAASIDTGEEQRDQHLRSEDFFAADTYPEIAFRSTQVEPHDGNRFRVVGDLTIRDTTDQVELEATVSGVATDPWGNERVGLELRGEIRPSDFGVDWNQVLETGGTLLGDRVQITADVSAVKAG